MSGPRRHNIVQPAFSLNGLASSPDERKRRPPTRSRHDGVAISPKAGAIMRRMPGDDAMRGRAKDARLRWKRRHVMKRAISVALAAAIGLGAVAASAGSASAGWYGRGGGGWGWGPPPGPSWGYGPGWHGRYYGGWVGSPGAAAAAGAIVGLAAGAAIASAAQPREVAPPPGVGWRNHVTYCQDRYRSYNPATDSFTGYDGRAYRCVGSY